MERTFEELLVEQCAPTLAGLKPASLFRYQASGRRRAVRTAAQWGRMLAPYGLTVRVLKVCPVTGACLIYLCRRAEVCRLLEDPAIRAFWRSAAIRRREALRRWCGSYPGGCAWRRTSPMRSAYSWAIPWRTWWGLSATGG